MTEYNLDRILMVIFEEVRKMPGKDLKAKLHTVRQDLDKKFADVIDNLCRFQDKPKGLKPVEKEYVDDHGQSWK